MASLGLASLQQPLPLRVTARSLASTAFAATRACTSRPMPLASPISHLRSPHSRSSSSSPTHLRKVCFVSSSCSQGPRTRKGSTVSSGSSSSSSSGRGLQARGSRRRGAARAEVQTVDAATLTGSEAWGAFADAVSGEWSGYASDFGASGEPIELPESLVPQAFREWGLVLFAWQAHASTLATPAGTVTSTTTRFMPTVGCDSIDPPKYSVQDEQFGLGSSAGVVAYRGDGSYALAWPGRSAKLSGAATGMSNETAVVVRKDDDSDAFFELEHCLVAQGPGGEQDRARVRLIQRFKAAAAVGAAGGSLPQLMGLTLLRERWIGPHHSQAGAEEEGVGSSEFAEGPPVGLDAVEGKWLASKMEARLSEGTAYGRRGAVVELRPAGTEEVVRRLDEEGAVLLPQGVWSRVLARPDGGMILKAGWLVEEDKAIVSRFDYTSAGTLEAITISTEERISRFA